MYVPMYVCTWRSRGRTNHKFCRQSKAHAPVRTWPIPAPGNRLSIKCEESRVSQDCRYGESRHRHPLVETSRNLKVERLGQTGDCPVSLPHLRWRLQFVELRPNRINHVCRSLSQKHPSSSTPTVQTNHQVDSLAAITVRLFYAPLNLNEALKAKAIPSITLFLLPCSLQAWSHRTRRSCSARSDTYESLPR